ncbi:YigZ family protein [Flavobacterium sp. j3]|uniref:YigZ family protein n=1 Tax=Flavobacterium aureirubrum TaxID=3133147 RepID=A0ABU9N5B5_9FLAO
MTDTYKTIVSPSKGVLLKEKNSKFFGYTFPITTEEDVKKNLELLKAEHPAAGHFCYAFQLGTTKKHYRTNDDGEPNNSAGLPIYGQIQSYGVTNTLVVIVRIYGGTKLGVGGLISAYKTAAQMALENSDIVERTIAIYFQINFDYKNMNKVMRIIKEKNLEIVSQKMDETCEILFSTRKKNAEMIVDIFENLFEIEIKKI